MRRMKRSRDARTEPLAQAEVCDAHLAVYRLAARHVSACNAGVVANGHRWRQYMNTKYLAFRFQMTDNFNQAKLIV